MSEAASSRHRVRLWMSGARPRTLGAGLVPVLVGTAAARDASLSRFALCLLVALGLQVGVNYLNDYADGVRGVDTSARVGPARLVASGSASPRAVRGAAVLSFAVAGFAGLALAALVGWELLIVGAASLLAAMLYSAGPAPYAGLGLGELFVFVFFGVVATAGTTYVHDQGILAQAWWSGAAVGLLAVAILVANNLRDIQTDGASGKRTLAVRLGDERTRMMYVVVVLGAFVVVLAGVALKGLPIPALVAMAALPVAGPPLRALRRAHGVDLIPILAATALLHLHFGVGLAIGLAL